MMKSFPISKKPQKQHYQWMNEWKKEASEWATDSKEWERECKQRKKNYQTTITDLLKLPRGHTESQRSDFITENWI